MSVVISNLFKTYSAAFPRLKRAFRMTVKPDVEALKNAVGFEPSTPIEVGVKRFVAWYRDFYGV